MPKYQGYHPLTEEPLNTTRADRVAEFIDKYRMDIFGLPADREDHSTVVQDFLTDVFHWAHQNGVDPEEVSTYALRMFSEEVQLEIDADKELEEEARELATDKQAYDEAAKLAKGE